MNCPGHNQPLLNWLKPMKQIDIRLYCVWTGLLCNSALIFSHCVIIKSDVSVFCWPLVTDFCFNRFLTLRDRQPHLHMCSLWYSRILFTCPTCRLYDTLIHNCQEAFVSLLNGRHTICVVISLKTVLQPHQRTTCQWVD